MKKASQVTVWRRKEDPGQSDGLSQQLALLVLLRVPRPLGRLRKGEESPVSTQDIKRHEWWSLMFFPELSTPTVSWRVIPALI